MLNTLPLIAIASADVYPLRNQRRLSSSSKLGPVRRRNRELMRIIFPRRFLRPRRLSFLFFITSLALFVAPTTALWPFPPKRFSGNALVPAGTLGLDDGDSRVIAFGDFNGD